MVPVPSESTRKSSPRHRRSASRIAAIEVVDSSTTIDATVGVARSTLDRGRREIGFGSAGRARHVLEREIVGGVLPRSPGFEKDRRGPQQIDCRHNQFGFSDTIEHGLTECLCEEAL